MVLSDLYRMLQDNNMQNNAMFQSAAGAPASFNSGYDGAVRQGKVPQSMQNPTNTQTHLNGAQSFDGAVRQGKGSGAGQQTTPNPMADPVNVANRLFSGQRDDAGAYGPRRAAAPLGYQNQAARQSRRGK